MPSFDSNTLYQSIISGDTKALAKAITLLESTLEQHQDIANQLLDRCLSHAGNSVRIAVTGVPGVGKSTFIDAFGSYLIEEHQKKVAVLAIDPSSQRTRGSILGDKTRMNRLSVSDQAFVRPSPSGDTLGGVAAETREAIMLCEAAGYDIILVETVGVGQSETLVHNMVDFFLLLLLPGAGDELQGIKRGIVEMADLIAINKSDVNPELAQEAKMHYKNAIHMIQGGREAWNVPIEKVDAVSGNNIETIYKHIQAFVSEQQSLGAFEQNRKTQSLVWFNEHLEGAFLRYVKQQPGLKERMESLRKEVAAGETSPRMAANTFIKNLLS